MTTGHESEEEAPTYTLLSWDSGQFGFPVARIASGIPATDLPAIAGQLREAGVRLAYWFSNEPPEGVEAAKIQAIGGNLVDDKITYTAHIREDRLSSSPASDIRVEPYDGPDTNVALRDLSRIAGTWSRFRVDPRVPAGVFETIYDAWIRRSVRREIADIVLVALRGTDEIVGMATVGRVGGAASIGLIAVDEGVRGRGTGRALVSAASEWATRERLSEIQVVTQRANRAACALYESCGFTELRVELVYHIWLS